MSGEPIHPANMVISVVSTTLVAVVLIFVAIRLFGRERIIMGTK
jgi:Trk K+ transport system NAD-binding subunit